MKHSFSSLAKDYPMITLREKQRTIDFSSWKSVSPLSSKGWQVSMRFRKNHGDVS